MKEELLSTLERTAGDEAARLVAADAFLERHELMLLKQFVNAARSEHPETRALSGGLWDQFVRDQLLAEYPEVVLGADIESGDVLRLTWRQGAPKEWMSWFLRSPLLRRLEWVEGDDAGVVLAAATPALEQLHTLHLTSNEGLRELLNVGLSGRVRHLRLQAWPPLDLVETPGRAPVTSRLETLYAWLTSPALVTEGLRALAHTLPTVVVQLEAFDFTRAQATALLAGLGEPRVRRVLVNHDDGYTDTTE